MIALALHEARVIGRRAVWPAALVLHAIAASLFVAIWSATGGVPLWQASVLQQLAAMDRLAIAVILTWLSTFVLADDETGGRDLVDWSAVTGRSTQQVLRGRVIAIALLAIVFMSVTIPAFAAAAEVSAASTTELAAQFASALGFACLCVGVTSIASVAIRERVAVWCTAMAFCLLAAFGIRLLDTTLLRAAVPAIIGVVLAALAPGAVRTRRLSDG